MFHSILLIFENEKICIHSITYACELAKRMDSDVTLLMLMEMKFPNHFFMNSKRKAIQGVERRIGKILGELSSEFLKQGIQVSVALRVGDAAQELLKFLADRPPVQAIIWGSGTDLPGKGHWMARVAGNMECPLLTVSRKM